ncbi:hypothetical protein CDAR_241341 [Caerostris darwini]|uniref:Secreted protein n=1 Tax=Caerostris darwini TaxID=1538125 RepID=A0AAV4TJ35_9ARAC|nr:hypothetical protein CDAR_241341 [Caerostris darwini]
MGSFCWMALELPLLTAFLTQLSKKRTCRAAETDGVFEYFEHSSGGDADDPLEPPDGPDVPLDNTFRPPLPFVLGKGASSLCCYRRCFVCTKKKHNSPSLKNKKRESEGEVEVDSNFLPCAMLFLEREKKALMTWNVGRRAKSPVKRTSCQPLRFQNIYPLLNIQITDFQMVGREPQEGHTIFLTVKITINTQFIVLRIEVTNRRITRYSGGGDAAIHHCWQALIETQKETKSEVGTIIKATHSS